MTRNCRSSCAAAYFAVLLGLALLSQGHPSIADEPDAGNDAKTIKVGILHSLTGFMAISETQLRDAELMAIDEINKAGGVLGKQVVAVSEVPQSRFGDVFPQKARQLVLQDKVAAVFGCWLSVSRRSVLPVIEQNNALLFYPVGYEGHECSKNVVYTGALPNQQALPAVDLLVKKGFRKIYLLGSDYIYPRMVNQIVSKHLKFEGLIGEKYMPLGETDYQEVVQEIKKAQPDVILSTIVGDSNIKFYNELAAQGVSAGDGKSLRPQQGAIPVVALLIAEDELNALQPAKVKGHLAAKTYFQSLTTPANQKFVKNFQKRYGKDRTTNEAVAAAYAQVHLWKLAVEMAGSTDVDAVRKAFRGGLEFDAPEGKIRLDPRTQHVDKKFRLGRIREDRQFDVIYESPAEIEPKPYPQVAFPGWNCDWTKGGLTRRRQ